MQEPLSRSLDAALVPRPVHVARVSESRLGHPPRTHFIEPLNTKQSSGGNLCSAEKYFLDSVAQQRHQEASAFLTPIRV